MDKQRKGPANDIWEQKDVMLALQNCNEWGNPDPAIRESLVRQVDHIIDQVGKSPKTEVKPMGRIAHMYMIVSSRTMKLI